MGVSLTLAHGADLDLLTDLVVLAREAADRSDLRTRLAPLAEGTPHGAAYLIGPPRAPVGYLIVAFGFSVQRGGIEARVVDIFIRPGVRRRGMASEAINALAGALSPHGVRALGFEYNADQVAAAALARRSGMKDTAETRFMVRRL